MNRERTANTFKPYSKEELETITKLYDEGHTAAEIAELTDRTTASIYTTLSKIRKGKMTPGQAAAKTQTVETIAPSKSRELSPREMIKKLYDLGFRIENNQLVCYVKQTIKLQDIIQNG